jgi:hypothetical protein
MGAEIKCKKIEGVEMYQLRSTISDELYHKEEWVTLDGAKKALMESKIWNFFEQLVEIDKEFPHYYHVNGKIKIPKEGFERFAHYALDNYYGKGGGQKLYSDVIEIINRLNLEIIDKPEIKFGLYELTRSDNERGDISTLIAISDTKEKLEEYCKTKFNKEIGKPKIFSWDNYYLVEPYTPVTVL